MRERESPASSSNVSRKGKEKVDDTSRMQNLTASHDGMDDHSSGFDSLDEEFGIPFVKMPDLKKASISFNKKLGRSTRFKKLAQRLMYDSYVAHHCAYMVKIV